MTQTLRDAALKQTLALPNGAASVTTTGFKVNDASYEQKADFELLITAPALAVGELANTATMKYELEMATDAAYTSPVSVYGTVLTQTGANGAGAAAATKRVRLPSDCLPYVRLKSTNSGAGNASGKSATLELLF